MLYVELYMDNGYTHLPLYKYLDNLPVYTDIITLWKQNVM